MKCPHCNSEVSNSNVCPNCGQRIDPTAASQQAAQSQPYPQQNYQSTVQQGASPYYYYSTPVYGSPNVCAQPQREKTGGEIAAIVIAVVVSVLSFFAAIIIFANLMASIDDHEYNYDYDDTSSYDDFSQYGIDDFTDEDSLDHFFDYYNSIFGEESKYPGSNPANEHTPVEFDDYLHSFSNGDVSTTYNVELDEAYRGNAALKLLEGAKLPEIDDGKEIYLAKFKVTVTKQETEAYVEVAPSILTSAYKGDESDPSLVKYESITYVNYKNEKELLKKGESGERWMAFIVEKTDERPLIMWDSYEGEYFRYSKAAESSEAGLEAGAAIESESDVSSN